MCKLMDSIIREFEAQTLVRNIETIADSIQGTEQDACRILKVSYEDYLNAKKLLEEAASKEADEVLV